MSTETSQKINRLSFWGTYIKCEVCDRSYVSIEVDQNKFDNGTPICDGCAVGSRARHLS